jgi:16S rRNA (cytosine1402-N4)-methyltransferase
MPRHVPVMTAEVVALLAPARPGVFIDCTVGLGGHAAALLEAGAGQVVGLDRDGEVLDAARAALAGWGRRVELAHADFRRLDALLGERGIATVAGVLADLGVSSFQLEGEGRGFSFQRDEPLDMRMDRSGGRTAADVVAEATEQQLADIIHTFGEERFARRIARAVVRERDRGAVKTTGQLARIVRRAVPRTGRWRIDPATRTFQALRIHVNGELDGLDGFLAQAARRLGAGGRLVVIAFHSLEDRIVKRAFRTLERAQELDLRIVTRRPIVPSREETDRNPRARSAKLRAIERPA